MRMHVYLYIHVMCIRGCTPFLCLYGCKYSKQIPIQNKDYLLRSDVFTVNPHVYLNVDNHVQHTWDIVYVTLRSNYMVLLNLFMFFLLVLCVRVLRKGVIVSDVYYEIILHQGSVVLLSAVRLVKIH